MSKILVSIIGPTKVAVEAARDAVAALGQPAFHETDTTNDGSFRAIGSVDVSTLRRMMVPTAGAAPASDADDELLAAAIGLAISRKESDTAGAAKEITRHVEKASPAVKRRLARIIEAMAVRVRHG